MLEPRRVTLLFAVRARRLRSALVRLVLGVSDRERRWRSGINIFWGKADDDGRVIEHYGRRCQGLLETLVGDESVGGNGRPQQCDYRFRFKECSHCGAENDIAARNCHQCHKAIIDPDDQLRDALKLKDAMASAECDRQRR